MQQHRAMAVALTALVFSLAGTGLASRSRYLITSTSQIKPSVLRQLQGRAGPTGEQGRPGQNAETLIWYVYRPQEGPLGERGQTGPTGATGATGP